MVSLSDIEAILKKTAVAPSNGESDKELLQEAKASRDKDGNYRVATVLILKPEALVSKHFYEVAAKEIEDLAIELATHFSRLRTVVKQDTRDRLLK